MRRSLQLWHGDGFAESGKVFHSGERNLNRPDT